MQSKTIIKTEKAPAPIGPYNQAIKIQNTLFVSGQIAIDPSTGELEVGDIVLETRMVMENIGAILEAADLTFEQVVKCSIFVKDMDNFAIINQTYGEYFKENAPARETVEVSKLPRNVNVEISCIACW